MCTLARTIATTLTPAITLSPLSFADFFARTRSDRHLRESAR